MARFFNTAGPVNCQDHYCLPPLLRFDLDQILRLIEQKKYFVLHAPRQTGKTSCLLALMAHLNQDGRYRCLYVNVEGAQAAREDVKAAMQAILEEMALRTRIYLGHSEVETMFHQIAQTRSPFAALTEALTQWCETSDRPIVLLVDEIDALVGDTLIAVLRQLRIGYAGRPTHFPQSVVLCGVRDVRDYRIHSAQDKTIITGGSAFNIKAESLRLGNFSEAETRRLYLQHTGETGQHFEADALSLAWELTRGQPWLVNALAYEVCFRMPGERDGWNRINHSATITAEMIIAAKERLIERRETHLDQLVDKLKEERVRRVIEPMLRGQDMSGQVSQDNIQYVIDLGLIQQTGGTLEIANPIYQEVIPRELTYVTQLNLGSMFQPIWYIRADGRLDMPKLMEAFQQFFREHSEHWVERFDYQEAGPQLLLQAFLQRVVNGGGRVDREYGLGRMRTDLLVVWPAFGQSLASGRTQRIVLKLKLVYKSVEETIAQGLEQTWQYMDRCGADEGHLVIFDRRPGKTWEDRLFCRQEQHRGVPITVWGM